MADMEIDEEFPDGFTGDLITIAEENEEAFPTIDHADDDEDSVPGFASDKVKLFQTRLENGFDVFDNSEYVS